MRVALLFLVVAVAALSAGFGGGSGGGGRMDVVATTTQAADLVRNVAGDRATVHGILKPNSDPHDYEPRPGDIKALADADVVVRSGGEVDEWLDGAIRSSGTDAPVLDLIEEAGPEGDDPHWWQDPRRAETAVSAIERELIAADPGGADGYVQRASAYRAQIAGVDAYAARCIASIPEQQRKLVTTHDALGYYARRYGLRVIGTVIPSLTTQAQPSAGDLAKLTETIERAGVPAIFAESAVNPKVERAIARESGARVGQELWADALGEGVSYTESIRANTRAISQGLGGSC